MFRRLVSREGYLGMLNINHVLGSRLEPAFSERIHRLEHHNAVDIVELSAADLGRQPLSPSDAIEIGYHVGNLHWRVRFEGEALLVAIEGRPEKYAVRLGELIWSRRVGMRVLEEDTGADAG